MNGILTHGFGGSAALTVGYHHSTAAAVDLTANAVRSFRWRSAGG
jgi:hypothetical protein